MNSATLINQDSGKVEYYTPAEIVGAARATMGGIDLDPASSEAANRTIRAARIYTAADDGLSQEWRGRIWLNHPFSRSGNYLWIEKAIAEFAAGRAEICLITFAATSERWFRPLLSFPQCFLSPRTNYRGPDGRPIRGVTKGSVVSYLGTNLEAFGRNFAHLGTVKIKFYPRQ